MASLRLRVLLVLLFPAAGSAQALDASVRFAPSARVAGPVYGSAAAHWEQPIARTRLPVLAVAQPDSTIYGHAARYALWGLAAGAVVGAAGGAIGSRYAGCGCSDSQKTIGFAIWFGAIGAGAGFVISGVIGEILDLREHR